MDIEVIMDELKEKIFDFDDSVSSEEIYKGLEPFFNDLYARKRNTIFNKDFRSLSGLILNFFVGSIR